VIGAVVVAVLLTAIGFLPLFGGPGYEAALAAGLVVPSAAAIATALDTARRGSPTPLAACARGVSAGLVYAALALATTLAHALRVGVCELWGALLYFVLTAGAGSSMGGTWGFVAGEITGALVARGRVRRARTVAVLLALAGPVLGVVVSLWRFYTSPMIFAFDPFVGYFSGTLYDTVIDAGTPLLTYRLGSLATLAAVALFASVLRRDDDRPFGLVLDLASAPTRARSALGLCAAAASVGTILAGTSLGHFSTAASIAADLGAERHGARCDVVYPSTTREQEANLLVKDCEEEVRAVEARLGTRGPDRIVAFFFRDENDKKRLMGAAHTYIAKPWRNEVYLQLGAYPHPVLGHELAHVIAGGMGRGAFRVAGDLGGYLPNPGLIEGVAVAASPGDEDLEDAQWARAMMQLGILPPMQRVFSLGFLGDASAKSYTLAGAFVGWIGDTWGMEAVRRWYGGDDIAGITGRGWPALDEAFRAHLATVPLPPEAESFARARFARPGIFGRRCPHVVDALRQEAEVCRDTHRFEEAIRIYREVLAKDPHDFASRSGLAQTMRRHGDRAKGRAELEAIASSEEVPRTWRDRAAEALADADLIEGDLEPARRRYAALASRSIDEDQARTFEVKRLATEDPVAREAITILLLGDEKHRPDPFVSGEALGRWEGRSPLASYLVGRNLLLHGFYERSAAALDAALDGALPTARVAREALRQRAIAACALGDRAALERVREVIEGPDDPFQGISAGRRSATIRMIARCSAGP
jgi:tetratricopeptide (TPR) repeat protein